MTTTIIILAACILMEAFFSGTEIALVAADKVKLRAAAERVGGRRAAVLMRFLDDPGELISTSLVGTNICVVLSTVVATLSLLPMYPDQAELISMAVMAPLVLVFGEIVPKSLFQKYADRTVARAIYLLWGFRYLFFPFVAVGTWLSNLLIRALRLEKGSQAILSREELRLLIRLSDHEGDDQISEQEEEMVERLFDFRQATAEDVMVPLSDVCALPIDATLEDLAQEITEKRHTRIPLYRDRVDQMIGVVHAFDLLRASPEDPLQDLSRPAIFVPESQPVEKTLVRLKREGQGMAVVVDEYGGATGVVTIEDILEEVVGEIDDEYDQGERRSIRAEQGGTFLVAGRAEVERINDTCGVELPEDEEYETIAGLILDLLERIPRAGEEVEVADVRLKVIAATPRSIERVRLFKK